MALSEITAAAIDRAIAEFDHLGQAGFHAKYGFDKARDYFLLRDGKRYPSKAIVGAAHGYLPGKSPLAAGQFSGGRASAKRLLNKLGFDVTDPDVEPVNLPTPGDVLSNHELGQRFHVGNMGGMRRSRDANLLLLISDPSKGLYQDRWQRDLLHYTGMGKTGDQELTAAQNRTLAESPGTGIQVHLVEALQPQRYTYVGEVELADAPYQEDQVDDAGEIRKVWMFPLRLKSHARKPVLTVEQARLIEEAQAKLAKKLALDELRRRAAKAQREPNSRTVQATAYVRDAAVAELVKRLANGVCDLCKKSAPFEDKHGEPYLESHHVEWLAKGGADAIENAVALCPNCHRRMHVRDSPVGRRKLRKRIAERETAMPEVPQALKSGAGHN
jgi:5-methylcytosine-specific restriction enzyme A